MINTVSQKKPKKEKYTGEGYHSITPAIKDNLWKVRQKHEGHLSKLWYWKWHFLLEQDFKPNFKNESIDQVLGAESKRLSLLKYKELEKQTYNLKKSPALPTKSADVIGWRSTNKDNSFDMFRTKPRVPKICFVYEQYGVYRAQKYIEKAAQETEKKEEFTVPRRSIVHNINPLIC